MADTILDRITEIAEIAERLKFCARALLRLQWLGVRPFVYRLAICEKQSKKSSGVMSSEIK